MLKLTSRKLIDAEPVTADDVTFVPTTMVEFRGENITGSAPHYAQIVIEMIHWLIDHNYVFAWSVPEVNYFTFKFKDEEAAIHFMLSH